MSTMGLNYVKEEALEFYVVPKLLQDKQFIQVHCKTDGRGGCGK